MSDVPILVTTSDPYNMADAADAEKRPVGDVDETVNDVTIGPSVNSSSPIRDTPIFVTCSHSETTLGDVSNVPEKQSVGDVDLTADDTAMCEPSSTTPTISAFLKSSRIPDTPILVGSIPQTTLGDVLDDTVERRMGDVEQAADDVAIGEPSSTVAAIGPSLQLSCSPKQRSANDFLRSSMSPQYPTIDPSVLRTHSPVAARRLSISVEKELSTSTVSESSNGAMDVSDDNPSAGLGQETARECAGNESAKHDDGDVDMSESEERDREMDVVHEEVNDFESRPPHLSKSTSMKMRTPSSVNRPKKRRRRSTSSVSDIEGEDSNIGTRTTSIDIDLYLSRWVPLVDMEFVSFCDFFSP